MERGSQALAIDAKGLSVIRSVNGSEVGTKQDDTDSDGGFCRAADGSHGDCPQGG